MDHDDSSNHNYTPFDYNSLNFDDEQINEWLNNNDLPPITPSSYDGCQGLTSTTSANGEYNNAVINNDPVMVDRTTRMEEDLPSSNDVAGSSSSKGKRQQSEKMKAVETERLRRQEMSGLYRSLRSILPAQYIRGKRSTADHLEEAVKYIKDMEADIANLREKRNQLIQSTSGGSSSNNIIGNSNSRRYSATVKKCREGFYEIALKTNGNVDYEENQRCLPLSKAFELLISDNFRVTNSISSKVGNNLIHTIYAEVDESRAIDRRLLQQQLINCYI